MTVIGFVMSRVFIWWLFGVTPWMLLGCDRENITKALLCSTVGAVAGELWMGEYDPETGEAKSKLFFVFIVLVTLASIVPALMGWSNVVMDVAESGVLHNLLGMMK
jgi:hypothetical protein